MTAIKGRTRQNGYAIRAVREVRGMSLSDLAQLLGITDPHMRNFENEFRTAKPEMITRIAEALDVSSAALVRMTKEDWDRELAAERQQSKAPAA